MTAPPESQTEARLSVQNLTAQFGYGPAAVKAADNLSYTLGRNKTLAIVGESGSGTSV